MSILKNTADLENQKFIESSSVSGQPGVVVVNPDGSSLGSGGSSSSVGNVAHDAVDSGNPVKIGGRAVNPASLPTAVAANDRSDMYTSLQGEVLVYLSRLLSGEDQANSVLAVVKKKLAASTYSPLVFTNYGANATLNIKATTGNVFSLACHNTNAASRYIQLHDTATTPGGGAVPKLSFLVGAGETIVIGNDFFSDEGINASNGWAFAFSTTEATYTAATAADQNTTVTYI